MKDALLIILLAISSVFLLDALIRGQTRGAYVVCESVACEVRVSIDNLQKNPVLVRGDHGYCFDFAERLNEELATHGARRR